MSITPTSQQITLQTYEGEARADTRQLAARMDVQHESVMRLLNTYLEQFEGLGHLRFEIGTVTNSVGAINQVRFALLNEDQCYFLLTLIRNNETTVSMKQELIIAFAAFRKMALTPQLPNFSDPVAAARAWADAEEARRQAQALAEANQEKALGYDHFLDSSGLYSVQNAAKLLGTGELRLFKRLRDEGILMSAEQSGAQNHNLPRQQYLDRGYFKVKTSTSKDGRHTSRTTYVTPKGLEFIRKRYYPETQLPLLEVASD